MGSHTFVGAGSLLCCGEAARCGLSMVALLCAGPAQAATWVIAAAGNDRAAGTEEAPLATLSEAIKRASDGDTLRIDAGRYPVPERALTEDLSLEGVGSGAVLLEAGSNGLRISGAAVALSGLTLTGGDGTGAAIEAGSAKLDASDVVIADFAGTGLKVRDSALTFAGGWIAAHGSAAVLTETTAVISDTIIQGIVPGLEPNWLVHVSGGDLVLSHSTVTGAYRGCLKGHNSAQLTVTGSVITSCGVLHGAEDGESMKHYAVSVSGASGRAAHSLINPDPIRPNRYGIFGDVVLDESVLWGEYPGYVGWKDRVGVLAISVDDAPNLDNARAIADEMSARDLHMTFFMNVRHGWSMTDSEWSDVRSLVADGHDVGGHAATNARLPQEHPVRVAWHGSGESTVTVRDAGHTLSVESDAGVLLTVDLTDSESNTMTAACALIDALSEHDCWLSDEFGNALPHNVDPTSLADGTVVLTEAGAGLPYDQRLPSAGGRHFTAEIVAPLRLIEEGIGGGYSVVSFAYPGQEHSPQVRDAVEDAGLRIARGAGGYSTADHLLTQELDRFQSPIALSNEVIRGSGYNKLSDAEKRARIETFAGAWASMAMEYGAMGALTIHGEETFSPEEVSWLLDAIAETDVRVASFRELSAYLDAEGGTGRHIALPAPAGHDYQPAEGSVLIDAGDPSSDRTVDRLGAPIYGAPDLGPHEFQPQATMGSTPLIAESQLRLYADGAFRTVEAGSGTTVPLYVAPDAGFLELPPQAHRPRLLDLTIGAWDASARDWSVDLAGTEAEALCMRIGGLPPGARLGVTRDGAAIGSVRVDRDGTAQLRTSARAGAQAFALHEDVGTSRALLPQCAPERRSAARTRLTAPEAPGQ